MHTLAHIFAFMLGGAALLGDSADLWIAALWWIFSAAVQTMPEPTTTSGPLYVWLYRFLNVLGANLAQAGLFKRKPGATL